MAGPHILSHLRTDDFTSLTFSKFQQMRDEKTHTDFTLCVDNTELPCHKIVLSAHSRFLDALTSTNMKEAKEKQAELKDINLDTMKIVMEYMYTGNISIDSEQLSDLLAASHFLQIDALTAWCVKQVPDVVNKENVLFWNELGEKYDIEEIKQCCIKTIGKELADISQQTRFLEMSEASIIQKINNVLQQNAACDDVLRAAVRWIDHDTEARGMHVAKLLDNTLLRKCSPRSLIDMMVTHRSLFQSSEEVYKLLTAAALQNVSPVESIIVVGGRIEETVNRLWWYLDQVSGEIVQVCSILPTEFLKDHMKDHSVCQMQDGFAVTGGDLCLIYNAASNSWSQENMQLRVGHGSICIRRLIYVFGGVWHGGSVEYLDVKNHTWLPGPRLPMAMCFPAVAEINDQVYVLDKYESKQLFKMDLERTKWIRCEALPSTESVKGISMLNVKGRLLVAGNGICAWYKPETDAWSMGHHRPHYMHSYGSLVLFQNKVLLVGGKYKTGGSNKVEEMNLEDETWSVTGWEMPESLAFHQALVLEFPRDFAVPSIQCCSIDDPLADDPLADDPLAYDT